MMCRTAEDCFVRGVEALSGRRETEAMALFEAAIAIDIRSGNSPPQARYISYFGLCLAEQKGRFHEGIRLCREALGREFYNPDLHLNLARLLRRRGRRREAWQLLQRGRQIQPGHKGIRGELRRMGRRRRPVVPFLARKNPINVALGRLACAVSKDGKAGGEGAVRTRRMPAPP